jgi:ubiquinone/menaquinone biosynthesis C-methylase UbiE
LYNELLKVAGRENIRTTGRTHETISVEDDWASLVIGQCILDEFTDASKAVSEISRILRIGGTALLSGPVSRGDRLRFERSGKPPAEILPLREVSAELRYYGLEVSQIDNLTEEIKSELHKSGRKDSKLGFENSMDYLLIRATKEFEQALRKIS